MLTVVDFIGHDKVMKCSKCGTTINGDRGYILSDGTAVCRRGDKCSMRANKAPEDTKFRWRK